ncbi:hypothetical protein VTJ04DRAFT_4460 [Mycothermus thermophilus]|uniref:uncharacterized protein n=1 Tax=Humicola insolens TaxID=85995 RepID=UPI0037427A7E
MIASPQHSRSPSPQRNLIDNPQRDLTTSPERSPTPTAKQDPPPPSPQRDLPLARPPAPPPLSQVETCLLSDDKLSFLNKLDKTTRNKVNKVLLEYFQQHRAELVPVKKPWRVRVREHLKKSRVRAFLRRILEHVVGGTLAGIISNIVSAGLIILMF